MTPNEPLHIITSKHPAGNGRTPQPGEHAWTFDLEIEGNKRLFLHMGQEDMDNLAIIVDKMRLDEVDPK